MDYQSCRGGFTVRLVLHPDASYMLNSIARARGEKVVSLDVLAVISKTGLLSQVNDGAEPYVFDSLVECFAVGERIKAVWTRTDLFLPGPASHLGRDETEEEAPQKPPRSPSKKLITALSDLSIISAFVYAIAGLWNTPPFDYRQTPHASLFLAINCFAVVMIVFYAFLRGWSCANPDCDGIFPKTAP